MTASISKRIRKICHVFSLILSALYMLCMQCLVWDDPYKYPENADVVIYNSSPVHPDVKVFANTVTAVHVAVFLPDLIRDFEVFIDGDSLFYCQVSPAMSNPVVLPVKFEKPGRKKIFIEYRIKNSEVIRRNNYLIRVTSGDLSDITPPGISVVGAELVQRVIRTNNANYTFHLKITDAQNKINSSMLLNGSVFDSVVYSTDSLIADAYKFIQFKSGKDSTIMARVFSEDVATNSRIDTFWICYASKVDFTLRVKRFLPHNDVTKTSDNTVTMVGYVENIPPESTLYVRNVMINNPLTSIPMSAVTKLTPMFKLPVTLNPGQNTIITRLYYKENQNDTLSVFIQTIILYDSSPKPTIISVQSGMVNWLEPNCFVNKGQVAVEIGVRGLVSPKNSAISLTTPSQTVNASITANDSIFLCTGVNLNHGSNQFTVRVIDQNGSKDSVSGRIVYNVKPDISKFPSKRTAKINDLYSDTMIVVDPDPSDQVTINAKILFSSLKEQTVSITTQTGTSGIVGICKWYPSSNCIADPNIALQYTISDGYESRFYTISPIQVSSKEFYFLTNESDIPEAIKFGESLSLTLKINKSDIGKPLYSQKIGVTSLLTPPNDPTSDPVVKWKRPLTFEFGTHEIMFSVNTGAPQNLSDTLRDLIYFPPVTVAFEKAEAVDVVEGTTIELPAVISDILIGDERAFASFLIDNTSAIASTDYEIIQQNPENPNFILFTAASTKSSIKIKINDTNKPNRNIKLRLDQTAPGGVALGTRTTHFITIKNN